MTLLSEIRALLVSPVKGRKSGDDAAAVAAAAETALAKLGQERSAAQTAIATAGERRRALLLRDETDAAIAALEAETERHHRTLERLELLEPELMQALQSARSRKRQSDLARMIGEVVPTVTAYAAAMRDARRAREAVIALRSKADAHGFAREFAQIMETPPIMVNDDELIDRYEATTERRAEGFLMPTPPRPAMTAAPAARIVPPQPDRLSHAVVLGDPLPPPRTKRTRLPQPVEGGVAVRVQRAGYETQDGVLCAVGDIITVSPEIAKIAVQNGALDYVTEQAA